MSRLGSKYKEYIQAKQQESKQANYKMFVTREYRNLTKNRNPGMLGRHPAGKETARRKDGSMEEEEGARMEARKKDSKEEKSI